jgi:hypothetical protein
MVRSEGNMSLKDPVTPPGIDPGTVRLLSQPLNHYATPIIRLIPVIIGPTGTISKSFRKHVSDIPGNHDVRELQKTAILGAAHRMREVLM